MKLSLIILFLTVLLLCGVLLHAANNNRKVFKIENLKEEVTKAELKRDMEFFPNVVLL
jgi:hypothetical protein